MRSRVSSLALAAFLGCAAPPPPQPAPAAAHEAPIPSSSKPEVVAATPARPAPPAVPSLPLPDGALFATLGDGSGVPSTWQHLFSEFELAQFSGVGHFERDEEIVAYEEVDPPLEDQRLIRLERRSKDGRVGVRFAFVAGLQVELFEPDMGMPLRRGPRTMIEGCMASHYVAALGYQRRGVQPPPSVDIDDCEFLEASVGRALARLTAPDTPDRPGKALRWSCVLAMMEIGATGCKGRLSDSTSYARGNFHLDSMVNLEIGNEGVSCSIHVTLGPKGAVEFAVERGKP